MKTVSLDRTEKTLIFIGLMILALSCLPQHWCIARVLGFPVGIVVVLMTWFGAFKADEEENPPLAS